LGEPWKRALLSLLEPPRNSIDDSNTRLLDEDLEFIVEVMSALQQLLLLLEEADRRL
jgi:hypothetical protein